MLKIALFAGLAICAISAFLAVIFGLSWILSNKKIRPFYHVNVHQVVSLHTYDPVTYNGVTVGHVIAIGLTQVDGASKVRITFRLDQEYVEDVLVNEKTTYDTNAALEIVSQGGSPLTPEYPPNP